MPEQVGSDTQIQSWLDRLMAGAEGAREELIRHASSRLCALTRTMLHRSPRVRRWEETDDVFQRAVMRLHQALADVQPASVRELFGLARTQIHRELIDLARHYYGPEGLGAHHETDADGGDGRDRQRHEGVDETRDPATVAEWTEFHQQVETLPAEEREVFGLRWYQGLTFEQIGQVIGAADRTAKRRWRSACRLLYDRMQAIPGEPQPR
jgi:RNA polymerase sigma-70 factor (ECF subfamily)